jgi:hypothetical protein
MKIIFLIISLTIFLNADDKLQKVYELYKNKEYDKVCTTENVNLFQYNRENEDFVLIYAFSCLNIDYIDSLATPIALLKYSEKGRANSAYFATILLQKKLLYYSLIDNIKISHLKLPSTEHVLSKVFDLYSKNELDPKDGLFEFTDEEDPKITYKLYVSSKSHIKKVVIEKYYDKILKNTHIYW